jgi:hypothetical protein
VKVLVEASAVLEGVCTMLFVHNRTHRKPAVKRSTAVKIDALCEYRHSFLCLDDAPSMMYLGGLYTLREDMAVR